MVGMVVNNESQVTIIARDSKNKDKALLPFPCDKQLSVTRNGVIAAWSSVMMVIRYSVHASDSNRWGGGWLAGPSFMHDTEELHVWLNGANALSVCDLCRLALEVLWSENCTVIR
jgi:hypothetical protein